MKQRKRAGVESVPEKVHYTREQLEEIAAILDRMVHPTWRVWRRKLLWAMLPHWATRTAETLRNEGRSRGSFHRIKRVHDAADGLLTEFGKLKPLDKVRLAVALRTATVDYWTDRTYPVDRQAINEVERSIENLRKRACKAMARVGSPKPGQPNSDALDEAVRELARIYSDLTAKKPKRTVRKTKEGQQIEGGPFLEFARAAFKPILPSRALTGVVRRIVKDMEGIDPERSVFYPDED